ncbi:MAG: SDR family oxidoreductase [Ectothiorhodospiraceae bacterium]|nr:SDR family oxidoreductase [Ectothiorhodospiraceae bacterium]MCH8503641.1 SDR family oxidoreductase [Ectothiorhodospiraceae bacterium]
MSQPPLQNQIVVITGGSRGIGLSAARLLGAGGALPVLFARGRDQLAEAEQMLRGQGVHCLGVSVDVRDPQAVHAAFSVVRERFARVDALVNGAGIMLGDRRLDTLDDADWTRILETNLSGAWHCIRGVLPMMRQRRAGTIINLSSGAAVRAGFLNIAYGVSKAGLDRLTLGVAHEVDADGIHCLSLSPPYTATQTVRTMFPDRDVAGQAASPDDTARAIRGLLLGDAADYQGRVVTVREYLERKAARG